MPDFDDKLDDKIFSQGPPLHLPVVSTSQQGPLVTLERMDSAIEKRRGDRGQPCRVPLLWGNSWELKPLVGDHNSGTDLQRLTVSEEKVNSGQQGWSSYLGPVESDTEESTLNSFNIITVENQKESDGNRESESTSDYQPPSEVNPESDNDESNGGKVHGVEKRIPLSGSKRRRGRPRKETSELTEPKCDVCVRYFATASGLERHRQLRHSEDRPYMCDTCGQCFALNRYLTRHMKVHTVERPHRCTVCGKRFFHKESLKNHMVNLHTGLIFKCDLCGKCLSTKGRLKLHRQNHTGEKSHPCKECDKAFYCESDLIKHTRTHTGEKPFQCKECGKCFGEKGSLTKHMMTHTQEKPHCCNECGRCFNLKGNLTVHMRTHTGEGVQCHLCGTYLKLAASLKRHLRTHRINIAND
uniref:zinc finger protein 567-like isoform X1 n=1 Tax=Oncorhynchus gorbuscha TaxID=8017 RepID=UPI001EAF7C89|nr:zinc finger protein 567-like isoform X1 [Oncorhynchus gorbuscha]